MKIKTVALIGAGAVGSYFIAGLAKKPSCDLWLIAEGERAERLKKDGMNVNGIHYDLHVKSFEEVKEADLILVSVKYNALHEVADRIKKMVKEDTIIISLLNGVNSEEILAKQVGKEHILGSMMKIAAQRVGNSVVYDDSVTLGLYFGAWKKKDENTTPQMAEKIRAVCELFDNTSIHYTVCDDILHDIWMKYALNISKNLPQAILGCGFGAYSDSEHVMEISRKLREEVVLVAKAKGIDISDEKDPKGQNSKIKKTARFSTLQDLDVKRQTEIDMFCGELIRMAKELDVKVPYNEFTYLVIKALEEKNAGKFDYED